MYIIYYKHMIVYISCFNWDFSFITEDFLKTNKKKKRVPCELKHFVPAPSVRDERLFWRICTENDEEEEEES